MKTIEERLEALEKHSHEPFDFTHLIERLEKLETANVNADGRLWALCYLHDWDPKREDGTQPVYPELHALYTSWQDAELVRKDMTNSDKYWVRPVRFESQERLKKVRRAPNE